MKISDVAVNDTIKPLVNGQFSGRLFIGTFKNCGADLAPFNGSVCPVSAQIQSELDSVETVIIAEEIVIQHSCRQCLGQEFRLCLSYLPLTRG